MVKNRGKVITFIALMVVLGILFRRSDIYKQVEAQTSSTNVTVDVFHLCLQEHIDDPDIDCSGFSAGSIRSVPNTIDTPWRCQANDPLVYQPYDWKDNWGCGKDPLDGQWHYPSMWANPVTLDIEEYLYDVLSPEMDPNKYPFEALKAQSIAARTKALRSAGSTINNSVGFQAFFPYARMNNGIAAVDSTEGEVIRYEGTLISAQFSDDHSDNWTKLITQYPDAHPYLQSMYDPEGRGGGHGEGMSQSGACRWVYGYDASSNILPKCVWQVQDGRYPIWDSYLQILTHYYAGIHVSDANGNVLTPDLRWNAVTVELPSQMEGGQAYNVPIVLQNSGAITWTNNTSVVYWWEDDNGQVVNSPAVTPFLVNDIVAPGEVPNQTPDQTDDPIPITISVEPPFGTTSAMYTLVLDLEQNGVRFSNNGWFVQRMQVNVLNPVQPTGTPTSTPTPSATDTPTPVTTPQPTPQTLTRIISQSSDDAGLNPSSCTFSTSWNEVYLGQCANGQPITSGFRFTNINIPYGSQIQEAYLEFTVDGTYAIPVVVTFFGEANGNAPPFSSSNRPDNRALTMANANWNVTNTWTLGDIHNSPNITTLIQEIVNRSDWTSGNAIAIIMSDAGSTANQHRRVIGYDRIDPTHGYNGIDHAARLVVTYIEGNNPTPTPGATPTPSPTATNTPMPTPTPQECNCVFDCDDTGNGTANASQHHGIGVLAALSQATDLTEYAGLLYQLRDDVLSQTEEGQRYVDLYYEYSLEIATLLLDNPALYDQGYTTLQSFVPAIEAIIDGDGDSVTITSAQIDQTEAFLDALVAATGRGSLRDTIIQERHRVPLNMMVGMTVDEAWDLLKGYSLLWQPPLALNDPYEAKAGRTIPVEFRIEDPNGEFISDNSVTVWIREVGVTGLDGLVGIVGVADDPNEGVKINNNQYNFNLHTDDLAPGTYYLVVSANSLPASNAIERVIVLTD